MIPPGTNFIMVSEIEDEFASDGEDGEFIEEVQEDEMEEEEEEKVRVFRTDVCTCRPSVKFENKFKFSDDGG